MILMTERQAEVYDAVRCLTESLRRSPTIREVAHRIGVSSSATVYKHLHAMAKKRYLYHGRDGIVLHPIKATELPRYQKAVA